jgi:hypothetical protein
MSNTAEREHIIEIDITAYIAKVGNTQVRWVTDYQSKSGTCSECDAMDGEVMTLAQFAQKQRDMHGGSDTCRCLWQFANAGQYVMTDAST